MAKLFMNPTGSLRCAAVLLLGASHVMVAADFGEWLAAPPKPQWIWSATDFARSPRVFFRRTFELPAAAKSARLYTTCDNGFKLWINGKLGAESENWMEPIEKDVAGLLQAGRNVIAADCRDWGGVAGLMLKLEVELADGRKVVVLTDLTWKATVAEEQGFETAKFDDAKWAGKLRRLGELGVAPWGVPRAPQAAVALPAKAPPVKPVSAAEGLAFFERKIRPVLAGRCYDCHSGKAARENKLKGGLQLDTRAGVLKGGDSGPALVAGKPAESMLIKVLRQEGKIQMPPKSKLPDASIADFERWISLGAPDPRDGEAVQVADFKAVDLAAGKQFWSFRPLRPTVPPAVQDQAWVRNEIDRFIRARQEAAGLKPNPVAPARTLLRRAYYDLVGLPPEPETVERFVAAAAVDLDGAYRALIDELLASPHYGERWARHWLDLARFAESNGYAFDRDRPNAWRYRNFVINALNADQPYDRFVRLQVAGDLLTTPNQPTSRKAQEALETLAATGYLVAGPFTTQQTQKERERSRYEQLDDIVHTLGTSLLGLTLGCARCHEHKYDPISQPDYYSLAAVFADVGFADTPVNLKPEDYEAAKAKYNAAHAPLVAARTAREQDGLPALFDAWAKTATQTNAPLSLGNWSHLGPFKAKDVNEAHDKLFGPERDWDWKKTYGKDKDELKWTERTDLPDGKAHNTFKGANVAHFLHRVIESPRAQVVTLSLGCDERITVWVNRHQVADDRKGAPAKADEIKVDLPLKAGRNEILLKLANGAGDAGFYFETRAWEPAKELAAALKVAPEKWDAKQRQLVFDRFKALDEEWLKLDSLVRWHEADHQPKPNQTPAYVAKARGSTYSFGADTYKVYLLNRGNPDNKKGEAAPGFLGVLMDEEKGAKRWLADESGKITKAPRESLADWLTDTRDGAGHLLARVLVNRLWLHHFGQGIVATPSDFGTRGEPPTHPDLLDWLARELIRGGWKLKNIHRLLMTSSAYMQAGEFTAAARQADPDNRLWTCRPPRRLEAEVIRDGLLAVSGKLERKMFDAGTLDEKNPRRSIYLTVKRGQLIPFLQLFDAPDAMQSVGNREESTVAPQALTLMNSPFLRALATDLARRARPDSQVTLEAGIGRAYGLAFSRPPQPAERQTMADFVRQQTGLRGGKGAAEQQAFQDFCHVLLCMNEFVYVD